MTITPTTPFLQVALGTMHYGTTIDESTAFEIIDRFVDAGEAMLDTANNYAFWESGTQGGESESLIGRWLASSNRRDAVSVATKIGARPTVAGGTLEDAEGLSAATVRTAVEGSLDRLGIETIDLCYAHIDDHDVPLDETLGAFHDLVEEGKIRRIAASNLRAERLADALAISQRHGWPEYKALQQRHSVIDPVEGRDFGVQQATTPAVFEIVRKHGLRLVAYSPLLEGAFGATERALPEAYDNAENRRRVADVYRVAGELGVSAGRLVLATLIAQNVTPLLGARTPAQLDDSLAARDLRLEPDLIARLSVHPALPARAVTPGDGGRARGAW